MSYLRLSLTVGLLVVFGVAAGGGPASAAPSAARYRAIGLGTLGGPNSLPNDPGISISPGGSVVGSADTPALNPFNRIPGYCQPPPSSGPCHVNDAVEWRDGVITDLGTLGGYNNGLFELNGSGVGVGFGETGAIDPQTSFPQAHAAVSKGGRLIDLGTLGGYESWASGINDRGQVAGYASNTTPDRYAHDLNAQGFTPYPSATQWHATLWQNGKARDLGTLGGPDSFGGLLDARGDVAGESFTSFKKNPHIAFPTMDPFLWQHGHMRDLGSFGGTFGQSMWMNNHGEVVGFSAISGNRGVHPFLWNGKRLIDLGTLGGPSAVASWVNSNGAVVGGSNIRGNRVIHGFLWEHGTMLNLPPAPGETCSQANSINARGQAVGADFNCGGDNINAMLWQNGHAYNLNNLIAPTRLHLNEAFFISARGQIACLGTLPNGDQRVALVTPAHGAAPPPSAATITNRPAANSNPVPTPAGRDHHDLLATLPERLLEGSSLASVIREAGQTLNTR